MKLFLGSSIPPAKRTWKAGGGTEFVADGCG